MKIFGKILSDKMMLISFVIAMLTLFVGRPKASDIDLQTIGSLFVLMMVVQMFQLLGVFEKVAEFFTKYVKNTRELIQLFILLAFFSSMLLTNDVAILTLIPLLGITVKNVKLKVVYPIVLICLAANLGSAFLPTGNPQNLFLYTHYQLSLASFLKMGFILCFVSLFLLFIATFKIPKVNLIAKDFKHKIISKGKLTLAIIAMIIALLGVFRIIPLIVVVIMVIILSLLVSTKIIQTVDYSLLLTFVFFFIAVGNIKNLAVLVDGFKQLNNSSMGVYFSSIILSQGLSNVPTAILWAPFTKQVNALFLGTNIGGMGTLIASLANLLAYKQYKTYFKNDESSYMLVFTITNVIFLIIITILGLYLLIS